MAALKELADAGNVLAMNTLGSFYGSNRGVLPRDQKKATEYYRKAAQSGSPKAMEIYRLSKEIEDAYVTGNPEGKAVIRNAAMKGNIPAMCTMLSYYPSNAAALEEKHFWFRQALNHLENFKDIVGLAGLMKLHATSAEEAAYWHVMEKNDSDEKEEQ